MDHLDESIFSRFFNDNRFWQPGVLVGAVRNLQSFDLARANVDGVPIQDDDISAKSGKKIEGVRKLHDPSAGKHVIGHSIVNLVYSGRRVSYPLACEVAVPKDEDMEYAAKNEPGLAMLKSAVRARFTQTVAHDSAYLCNEIMEFLDSKKIPWVSKGKSNRILIYKGRRLHAEELGLILAKRKFRRHKRYRDIEYASAVVELPGHGYCRFVTAKNFREDEPDGADVGMKYFIASDPCWHGSTVMRVERRGVSPHNQAEFGPEQLPRVQVERRGSSSGYSCGCVHLGGVHKGMSASVEECRRRRDYSRLDMHLLPH